MAFEIFARAQAKWRGILVYALLQAAMKFVTSLIWAKDPAPGINLYVSLACLATTVYCLARIWQLLMSDHEGDEKWPPLWA